MISALEASVLQMLAQAKEDNPTINGDTSSQGSISMIASSADQLNKKFSLQSGLHNRESVESSKIDWLAPLIGGDD